MTHSFNEWAFVCYINMRIIFCRLDEQNGVLLRPMKLHFGKSELRRQCSQLRKAHYTSLPARKEKCHIAQALVRASRIQPLQTTRLLSALKTETESQNKRKRLVNPARKILLCWSNKMCSYLDSLLLCYDIFLNCIVSYISEQKEWLLNCRVAATVMRKQSVQKQLCHTQDIAFSVSFIKPFHVF